MSRTAAILLLGALAVVFAISLALPWHSLVAVAGQDRELAWLVLFELRLPRALLALIYGATLGASGGAIQAWFATPLASPALTRTSPGSKGCFVSPFTK